MTRRAGFHDQPPSSGNAALWIGLCLGGALVLTMMCGCLGIAAFRLWNVAEPLAPQPPANPVAQVKRADVTVNFPNQDAHITRDPKWLDTPDFKKLLPGGRWKTENGEGYEFRPDGAVTYFGIGVVGGVGKLTGTFRATGTDTIDLTLKEQFKTSTFTKSYLCLVNDDEMALLANGGWSGKETKHWEVKGKYYRMRDDGQGLGRTVILDPLIAKLKAPDANAQHQQAFLKLEYLGEDAWPAVPELIRVLEANPDKTHAMVVLQKIGPKANEAVPILRNCLKSGNVRTVDNAIWALRDIGPAGKEAVPELRNLTKNMHHSSSAAKALLSIQGPEEALAPTLAKLRSKDAKERVEACGTLVLYYEVAEVAVPDLIRFIEEDPALRHPAMHAIAAIGPKAKAAVPVLRKQLANESTRGDALRALHAIGPDARDAIPDIRRLLPDNTAAWALKNIEKTP